MASYPTTSRRGLGFLYIPPVGSQDPVGAWNIPQFPFDLLGLAVYHPEDALAVAEHDER